MKPVVTVPPAQAEALFDAHNDYDAQDDLRGDYLDDYLTELRRCDRTAGQPWRDDDADDLRVISDPLGHPLRPVSSFGQSR